MNKLIKEEINRIREVMGLKLLNESVIPPGTLKKLLADLIGTKLDDALDAIGRAAPDYKTEETLNFIKSLRDSQDKTVQNFVDSLDEVAVTEYKGMTSNLMNDLINGKLADEIEEEIFAKIASKNLNFDKALIDKLPLPDNIKSLYKQTSGVYTSGNMDSLKQLFNKEPKNLDIYNEMNDEISDRINALENGALKRDLLKNWNGQLEYFNKNIVGKGVDESVPLSDDEIKKIIDNINREFADESEEATEQTLLYSNKSPIYKTVKELYPGMKDANLMRITEEVGAKIIEANRLIGDNQALISAAEQVWGSVRMTTARREALIEEAIKKSNPKVGMTELQYWKNWWLGRDQATGKSLSLKERYKKYVQMNAIILVLNLVYNNQENILNLQLDDLPGDTAAEKFWNVIGGEKSILKAMAPFQLGFLGFLAADWLRTTVQPEFDQLYEKMGPGGYGWYKNIGDIEKVEDTNNPIKNSYKIILKQPKDGKSNLGSWTYDEDSKQLIQTAAGDFEIPKPAPQQTTTMTKEEAIKAILPKGYIEPITFSPNLDNQTSYTFVDAEGTEGTAKLVNGNINVE
jgi:hypothetical protein